MLTILESPSDCFETSKFGGFCPYWIQRNNQVIVANTAPEMMEILPKVERILDPVAVLELIRFNYISGDRTLVQGVQRMPWHSTLTADGILHRHAPIPHGVQYMHAQEVAQRLQVLLEQELLEATQNRTVIYLLLSGGLDSRVIAGILKRLEAQIVAPIVCVTWGLDDSRDVVYARKLASWYGWDFVHIPYDLDLVWANIERGALWGGAEVAGIHLHGMDWFRQNAKPGELVVAASFGDSIGRAEFSSVHLRDLHPMDIENTWGLLHPALQEACIATAHQDRALAWSSEFSPLDWVRNELDMQENYMRRMICHAMDYIRQFCDLHQAFTSEEVVSFMWSLSPDCRTDAVYRELLKALDPKLQSLPWARTGVGLDGTCDDDAGLRKEYHEWGKWLRHELRPRLEKVLFSSDLLDLGVLYGPALERAWEGFLSEPDDKLWHGETIVKICGIELARDAFNLQACRTPTNAQDAVLDRISRVFLCGKRGIQRLIRNSGVRKI